METKEVKSPLSELWPPKWFFTFSNLSVLLMTFFIVLATMFSMNIPLNLLASKELRKALDKKADSAKLLKAPWEEGGAGGPGGDKKGGSAGGASGGSPGSKEGSGGGEGGAGLGSSAEVPDLSSLKITPEDAAILKQVEGLDIEQIYGILDMDIKKQLADQIRKFVEEKKLQDFILVEEKKWKIKITPAEPFFFEKGSDVLKPGAKILLDQIGDFLKKNTAFYLRVEGHTDSVPINSPRFKSNWELSMARANSVMRYMVEKNQLQIQRVEAVGYGEFRPVAGNENEDARTKNRRVVLEILPIIKRDEL